ncbi:MAG: VWA domain-containing protein [Vicinamibacterales bacterium]
MGTLKFTAGTAALLAIVATVSAQEPQSSDAQSFRFRSGVELINVTATVSDGNGRFVSGLRQDDFRVYEDGQLRPITHFTSERVPVSLGIVLDTSGSMSGEKMLAARQALQRFLSDLLGPDDEVFLYRFDTRPERLHGWTTDREQIADTIRRIQPRGATTLYDAIAEAVPLAATGRHRKKALLIISDGNDTSSYTRIPELKRMIRESEVLVYAIGIDAMSAGSRQNRRPWYSSGTLEQRRPRPTPFPFPIPGGPRLPPRGPAMPPRYPPPTVPTNPRGGIMSRGDEPVNVAVLREITDDSGGRTEVIWTAGDLGPATAGIADELSQQYFLGYPAATEKDGKWHTIRVEVGHGNYVVRARRGYMATP